MSKSVGALVGEAHRKKNDSETVSSSAPYDWEKYEKLLDEYCIPKTYKPAMMAFGSRYGVNLSAKSNWCLGVPWCLFKYAESQRKPGQAIYSKISQGEPIFEELLKSPVNPNCPDDYLGVWWQRDGSEVETMITFHDADWVSKQEASKEEVYGWTFTPNWIGYVVTAGRMSNFLPISVSPSGKWCFLGTSQFMYTIQPGDSFTDPDTGTKVDYIKPGDKMRVQLADQDDPSKGFTWQYLVQKVAYKDETTGKVVLTHDYVELKRRATYETAGICCDTLVICPSEEQELQLSNSIRDEQFFFVDPGPGVAARG